MMRFKCLASGSKRNCYYLQNDKNEILILDAGISISEIKKGIGFKVSNIAGALITHSHL